MLKEAGKMFEDIKMRFLPRWVGNDHQVAQLPQCGRQYCSKIRDMLLIPREPA